MVERKSDRKRALVTGATGFVGSNLVRGLISKGWKVDVIVRSSSRLDALEPGKDNLTIHVFNGEMERMLEIVLKATPDVVFHIASMVVGEHEPEQIESLVSSNITFGSQLLEAMSINGVSKFINTGTYWEHYENRQYSPANLYAATKYAYQAILQYYVEARGIEAITLKLFDPYGPNDPRPKLLNLLLRVAETGELLAMSPGEQKIDLVYIDDVVEAYEVAAKRLAAGEVEGHEIYGVGSGQAITLKELVGFFERETEKKVNIEWGERPYRDREVMMPWNQYKVLPGLGARVSFNKGLKSLFSQNRTDD